MATETKKIEDMSDAEIADLTPEAFAAMVAAGGDANDGNDADPDANDGNAQAGVNQQDDGKNAEDEEAARLAAEQAAATAAKANAAKDDAHDDDDAKGQAAPGAKAGEGGDDQAGKGPKDAVDANKGDGKEKVDDKKANEPAAVNYEEEHKKLLAPFKANGRDIQVANVDEARQLMQMGANYAKKMQSLKPQMAILRMLDNAKLGEAELSFLIDVHRKDPAAINKLVKDSGIDPMDLSTEKADGYKPGNHKPHAAEVELDTVLAELHGSEGLPKTIDVVSKQWDDRSKGIVAANPQLLKVVNSHVEAGIYDLIAAEVERQRLFGGLTGLSDLEAYRQVGDEMNATGKFAHIGASAKPNGQQAPGAPIITPPNPKKADDSKRNEQKRGVAPVKGAAPAAKTDPDFNPLSISDEEFTKKFGGKF